MENHLNEHKARRKRRIKNPTPFKSKLKHFIIDHKQTLIFLLFMAFFLFALLFSTHFYWKREYERFGQGHVFQD